MARGQRSLLAASGASWSLKPIFGMLSDALVVFGYRRLPWIVLTAVLATAAYSTIFAGGRERSAGPAVARNETVPNPQMTRWPAVRVSFR